MKTKCYALLDVKAGCYGTPFFMPNKMMALRSFQDFSMDRNTMVAKHPEDFSLFEIGEFDDDTGILSSQMHLPLGNALQFAGASAAELPMFSPNGKAEVKTPN